MRIPEYPMSFLQLLGNIRANFSGGKGSGMQGARGQQECVKICLETTGQMAQKWSTNVRMIVGERHGLSNRVLNSALPSVYEWI